MQGHFSLVEIGTLFEYAIETENYNFSFNFNVLAVDFKPYYQAPEALLLFCISK